MSSTDSHKLAHPVSKVWFAFGIYESVFTIIPDDTGHTIVQAPVEWKYFVAFLISSKHSKGASLQITF